MTVYEWFKLIADTQHADSLQIDLAQKTLTLKAAPVVAHGKLVALQAPLPDGGVADLSGLIDFQGEPYAQVERLYARFKRSVPSKQDRLNKGNFKAVSSDQLSYRELENNMPRQEARILLEGFVMLAAAAGLIHWKNPDHFFWQGCDPDLILYRDWIKNEEEIP